MVQDIDKDDVEEEWRDIDIYPQYQISNIGNVVRKKDGLLLKQYPQKSGYVYVVLDRGEGRHYVPIHRLVCIAFHGMDGYVKGLYVDHINTIRSDNRACNLRWVTAKENANNETTKLNRKRKLKVMKANEAPKSKFVYPDKLYARTNNNITLDISYAPQTLEAVEYTRTDAFIEKACNGIEKLLSGYIIRNFHFGDSYDIDRLIEDFKRHMKGE